MFQLNVLIDTSALPTDLMSLRDDKFFDFVRDEAGDAAAELLEVQGINCVRSLLMTPNVYSIMDVKSKHLENFKKKHGYIQDDNTFVLKSGVKGNVDYLIDLLQQKCVDDAKSVKFAKRNKSLSSNIITYTSSTTTNSTLTIPSNNSSSTTTNSTLPIPSNNSSSNVISKTTNLSITEHKAYVEETINKWCANNKSIFDLLEFSLVEGLHYVISIVNGPNNALIGNIKCCCQRWISLTINRGKFQLSNFYRHLQGTRTGKKCTTLEEMMKNHRSILPIIDNQEPLAGPDTFSHQTSSSPSNIMPSPSTISTTTSDSTIPTSSSANSTSTGNRNSIENSSSLATKKNKRKTSMIESPYSTRQAAKRTRRE